MQNFSIAKKLHIAPGTTDDYKALAHYHYRGGPPGPVTAIYTLKPKTPLPGLRRNSPLGVVLYSAPLPALKLRNYATLNMFKGLDRSTQLQLVNANIRCISRLIIKPRFRSLGLATRLVRETMPLMDVPIVEAIAVMGFVNPFLEKAGMTRYEGPQSKRHARLIEAFSSIGIEQNELLEPQTVHDRLCKLRLPEAAFIEREILIFIESYPRWRKAPPSLGRTNFILTKLTTCPLYYIWFNNKVPLRTTKEIQ